MTSSAPGDDVTLDDVVARVRELPTPLRSLYVETDGWTDWARSHDASSRREGLLAPSTPVDPDARNVPGTTSGRGWCSTASTGISRSSA